MKKLSKYFIPVLCLALAFMSCSKSGEQEKKEDPKTHSAKGEPIKVVDGKVRFFIDFSEKSPSSVLGIKSLPSTILISGKEYTILKDANSDMYVDVDQSVSGSYAAAAIGLSSTRFYPKTPNIDVMLPHSQFYDSKERLADFPRYATYDEKTANILYFNEGFALLDLKLKGDATIVSVKVSDKGGSTISGKANYSPSKRRLAASAGLDAVCLNTSGSDGVSIIGDGCHFYLAFLPDPSIKELIVTVCDYAHRMMSFSIPVSNIGPGSVIEYAKDYFPDTDLLYFEGFDRFVWGGDPVGGRSAFAPDADKIDISSRQTFSGFEDAFTSVSATTPGTGYFQSNDWEMVSGKTVKESHAMTESYCKSRGLWDYQLGFRSQEYLGYVSVGTATTARGLLQTGMFRNISNIATVRLSMDIAKMTGFNDDVLIEIRDAGYITDVSIDGSAIDLTKTNLYYLGASSIAVIPGRLLQEAKWHKISLSIKNATGVTSLYVGGNSTDSGNHGIYVDNIEVRKIADIQRGNLRVLYWNIQCGMWADQGSNYDNFVKWIAKYSPDVCVFCETTTIYKTNSSSAATTKYLPGGWAELAKRYGHAYSAIGGWRDNHPQVVTSKYPIETLEKITNGSESGKPISHGAGLQRICCQGRNINIVTLHTWPQDYAYGVPASERSADAAKRGGDYYREYEVKYIISRTVNNSKYSSEKDWLMLGDFNSWSRVDNFHYCLPDSDPIFLCQDAIINNTSLIDVFPYIYKGDFFSTLPYAYRIDFIYASASMAGSIKNLMMLGDEWSKPVPSPYVYDFWCPSDHRPILVDFAL